jgi:hypothetical protein
MQTRASRANNIKFAPVRLAKFWKHHVQISIQFHELFTQWSNHTPAISVLLLLDVSLAHQFYFQLFEILAARAFKKLLTESSSERAAFSGKNQWCVVYAWNTTSNSSSGLITHQHIIASSHFKKKYILVWACHNFLSRTKGKEFSRLLYHWWTLW